MQLFLLSLSILGQKGGTIRVGTCWCRCCCCAIDLQLRDPGATAFSVGPLGFG